MLTRNNLKSIKYNNNMTKNKIIYYDFETNGLNPYKNEIIEIGAKDNFGNIFNRLCKSELSLSDKITEITGLTDDILEKKGNDCKKNIIDFLNFINSYDDVCDNIYLIAHNNDNFDEKFLKFHLNKFSTKSKPLLLSSKIKFIDSLRVAQFLCPQINYFSQQTLCKYFNINNNNAHRALNDVYALSNLFEVLLSIFYQKYQSRDLKYLIQKLQNPFT